MTEALIAELTSALSNTASIDAIWTVIEAAEPPFRDGTVKGLPEASFAALISMRAVSLGEKSDKNTARFVEWNAKVAMCSAPEDQPKEGIQIQQARTYLGKFIRGVRWPLRLELIKSVHKLALERVGTDQSNPACWLIGSVGWRSPEVESALWDLSVKDPTKEGDVAFGVLVELGVLRSKKDVYLREAHRRFPMRRSRQNLFAIAQLASPESLPLLTFPKDWKSEEEKTENVHYIPGVIARIADHSESKDVAKRGIELLKSLFRIEPDKVGHSIYLAGNVVSSFDCEQATMLLLDQLGKDGSKENPAAYPIYLLLHRLEQCTMPNQIAGFEKRRTSKRLKSVIRQALTKSNEYTGNNATFEGDIKDHLWNISLMIGSPETLPLAFEFLRADKNPYARYKTMEDLACFRLRPIPKQIATWIKAKEEYEDTVADSQSILRSAALRVAWSSESEQGFQTLLESQYTVHGMTLADSADGLAHLAVLLAKQSRKRRQIVGKIFSKFDSGPSAPTAGMICEAIYALAHSGLLSTNEYEKLRLAVLAPPSWMREYDKTRIVSAVGTGPKKLITGKLREKLIEWAKDGDGRLATACFEALISAECLSELPADSFSRLGLSRNGDGWAYASPTGKTEPNGGLLVMLLRGDFDAFADAFSSFLEFSSFASFIQATESLGRNIRKKKIPFDPRFSEALLRRAGMKNTFYDAEPYVVQCLAEHDFKTFAIQDWSSKVAEWPSQSREALATAFLVGGKSTAEIPEQAISTLVSLHSDGTFGVRRAAFRSLGVVRPSLLASIVRNLAVADSPSERILASEAIYWIPRTQRDSDWNKVLQRLTNDVGEEVREATYDAGVRARKLVWAQEYSKRITEKVSINPNRDVLNRWKYAQALVHVGDDQTALQIRRHLQCVKMPAGYQRFLIKTTQKLEQNWEKCRSKWPEPTFAGQASFSVAEGKLVADGEEWSVRYAVWRNIDLERPDVLTFAGVADLPRPTRRTDLLGKELALILSDGNVAKIFVHRIENQRRIEFGVQEAANVD